MALLGMKRSRSSLAVAISRVGERHSLATGVSRYKQPVRHCFDRCRSGVSGPSCLINLGGRKITPGAIDETQVERLTIESHSRGYSTCGFLKAERWRAPLNIADLAVANLTPHTLLGSGRCIILHGQVYSTLRSVIEDLKEHGKFCGGILVSRHVSIPSRAATALRRSPSHG